VIAKAGLQTRNGHHSMKWALSANRLLGIRIAGTDPAYSATWADRNMWQQGGHWDEVAFTVGDARTTSKMMSWSGTAGDRIKAVAFRSVRYHGYVPPGTVLGIVIIETEDGRLLEGKVSLVEVTEELLYPFKRSDATEGRQEKVD
jgi:hypothetical protein